MSGADVLFYLGALVAVGAAVVAALRDDLRHAVTALLVAAAGVTAVLALLGAWPVAALEGAVVAAGIAAWGRVPAAGASGDHATLETPDSGSARQRYLGAALLVAAFLVISARVVLMARWPIEAGATASAAHAVTWLPAVSLPHHLLAALLLFGVGLFAAITRRSFGGLALAAATLQQAVALAIVAAGRFVGGLHEAVLVASLVVALSALTTGAVFVIGSRAGSPAEDDAAARSVATTMFTVLAGVTLVLMAGAW